MRNTVGTVVFVMSDMHVVWRYSSNYFLSLFQAEFCHFFQFYYQMGTLLRNSLLQLYDSLKLYRW